MNALLHNDKRIFWLSGTLFIVALLAAIFFQNPILVAIPFALVFMVLSGIHVTSTFFVLLVSIPFSFNIESLGIDFPDELLMLWLSLLTLMVTITNWNQIRTLQFSRNPIFILLVLSLVWLLIVCLFSTNVLLSFKFFLKKLWYVLPFFLFPLLLFQNTLYIKRAAQFILFPIMVVVVIVLFRQSLVGFRFDMIYDPMQPFFMNHVLYGSTVSCVLPLAVAGLFLSRKLSIQWVFAILAIILLATASYFSYSRAAWLAVIFSLLVFTAVKMKIMHWVLLLFYGVVLAGILWLSSDNRFMSFKPVHDKTIMHETLEEHIMATIQGRDISSAERYYRWIAALRMSNEKPIVGVGPNNFYEHYKQFAVKSFRTWVSRNPERSTTHNYFIYLLVEQGYPGMILYGLLYYFIFYYGQIVYHKLKDKADKIIVITAIAILSAIFMNNFLSELLETDKIGSLFFMSLAVLVVYHVKLQQPKQKEFAYK